MPAEINALLHNPLMLGVGLAGFGLLWFAVAAVISIVLPGGGGSEDEVPVRTLPVSTVPSPDLRKIRFRMDDLYGYLQLRIAELEKEGPSAVVPPEVRQFNQRVERLKADVEEIRRSLGTKVLWGAASSHLKDRVEDVARRAETMLSPDPAPAAVPAPSFGPVAAEVEKFLADVRKEREGFLERERSADRASAVSKESLARESAQLRESLEKAGAKAEALKVEEEQLVRERDRREQMEKEIESQRGTDPLLEKLRQLEAENARRKAAAAAQEEAAHRQRMRYRQRMDRLSARLVRWRTGWEARLGAHGNVLKSEEQKLQQETARLRAEWDLARRASEENFRRLEDERARAQLDKVHFEADVKGVWLQEKAEREKRLEGLEREKSLLEGNIEAVQKQQVEEKERFAEALAAQRRAAREQQARWKEQLTAIQSAAARQSTLAAEEVQKVREAMEYERQAVEKDLETQRALLNKETAEWTANKSQFENMAAEQRRALEERLAATSGHIKELQEEHGRLRAELDGQTREYALRREDQRRWAEQRFRTLNALLENTRKELSARLEKLREEKSVLASSLEKERRRYQETLSDQTAASQVRQAELRAQRQSAEQSHAEALSRLKADEEKRRAELSEMERTLSSLEKKLTAFRQDSARRLRQQRDRYERLLLVMEQKASQEKVTGEARHAQEKLALESLEKRVANRRARLEKVLDRRRTELERLFVEAEGALEVVRQGHFQEARAWSAQLEELQRQRQSLEAKRAGLEKALGPEALEQQLKDLSDRFEAEKARLAREGEEYGRASQEKSAAHHEAMQKAFHALEEAGEDLHRQETAAVDFLAAVQKHVSHLQSLRDYFRQRENRMQRPSSSSSVA
ncbi:MAG TPA: hypothetical protein P5079_00875 [Elusimicrobiota bacterium]|nr:hypothetical protein [Elusimicrobiota bacterium]